MSKYISLIFDGILKLVFKQESHSALSWYIFTDEEEARWFCDFFWSSKVFLHHQFDFWILTIVPSYCMQMFFMGIYDSFFPSFFFFLGFSTYLGVWGSSKPLRWHEPVTVFFSHQSLKLCQIIGGRLEKNYPISSSLFPSNFTSCCPSKVAIVEL